MGFAADPMGNTRQPMFLGKKKERKKSKNFAKYVKKIIKI